MMLTTQALMSSQNCLTVPGLRELLQEGQGSVALQTSPKQNPRTDREQMDR